MSPADASGARDPSGRFARLHLALVGASLFSLLNTGAFTGIIPYSVAELGQHQSHGAWMNGEFFAAQALGMLLANPLAERVGALRLFLAAGWLTALGGFLCAGAPGFVLFLLARILLGAGRGLDPPGSGASPRGVPAEPARPRPGALGRGRGRPLCVRPALRRLARGAVGEGSGELAALVPGRRAGRPALHGGGFPAPGPPASGPPGKPLRLGGARPAGDCLLRLPDRDRHGGRLRLVQLFPSRRPDGDRLPGPARLPRLGAPVPGAAGPPDPLPPPPVRRGDDLPLRRLPPLLRPLEPAPGPPPIGLGLRPVARRPGHALAGGGGDPLRAPERARRRLGPQPASAGRQPPPLRGLRALDELLRHPPQEEPLARIRGTAAGGGGRSGDLPGPGDQLPLARPLSEKPGDGH
ncbi:membrane protein of unknown function [Methylacidimicrobium sp. AP8]|nr:membrane protein of unknown function [Methylacidimicrobium sp. AP8]